MSFIESYILRTIFQVFLCLQEAQRLHGEIMAEVEALTLVEGHPHILRMMDSFDDKKSYHLILEWCRGGDLFEYMASRETLNEFAAGNLIG